MSHVMGIRELGSLGVEALEEELNAVALRAAITRDRHYRGGEYVICGVCVCAANLPKGWSERVVCWPIGVSCGCAPCVGFASCAANPGLNLCKN